MKKKILIVDDDQSSCEVFSALLAASGYETDIAHDGEDALFKLEKNRYDLVISDIFMPKLNGIELLKKVKETLPGEKVIMVTGQGTQKLREESLKGGAVTFLEKPLRREVLLEAVRKCIDQEGFDGNVSEISLFDLIQFLTLARKTKILDIVYGEQHGQIYIHEGNIVHAVTKKQIGEKAFHECLSWKSGFFKDFEYQPPRRVTINKNVEHLLLDAAKIMDETTQKETSTREKIPKKETLSSRLHPFLTSFMGIDGISAVVWLDKTGQYIMGEGTDQELLKSIPKFILGTEERLKNFYRFPRMERFCLQSHDGRKIYTVRFKQILLSFLIESGFEPGPIQDNVFQILKNHNQGRA